jgi:hypothetical protein
MVIKAHIKMPNPLIMVILILQMVKDQLMRMNIPTLINLLHKTKTKTLMIKFNIMITLKEMKINRRDLNFKGNLTLMVIKFTPLVKVSLNPKMIIIQMTKFFLLEMPV